MPVSPDFAAGLAKSMADLFGDAEVALLQLIARRLARGIDEPSWADRQLLAVHDVLGGAQRLAQALSTRSESTLSEIIKTAFNRGAALAGTDLAAAGVHRGIAFGGVNLRAVQALVDTQQRSLTPIGLKIQSQAGSVFQQVVQTVAGQMLTGTATRRTATVNALNLFTERGVTGFQDRAGRNWDMTGYAEMVARTAASQAIVQGHVDQLSAAGFDLVMVSDAPEECKLCRPFEGAILSLDPAARKGVMKRDGATFVLAGSLADATKNGLFHPNCRHRTVIFIPGVTKRLRDTADPEGDALRQKQRAYERRVRELKRKAAVAVELDPTSPETARIKAQLKAKQAEFKTWRDANGRKNLAYRTQVDFKHVNT